MGTSVINITFSAGTSEGVNKFAGLVYANVSHITGWHVSEERTVECTQGPNGHYWTGLIMLTVNDKDLNSCLLQLDAVDAGMVEGADEVLELCFGDMRYQVVPVDDNALPAAVVQINSYLLNKVQEQAKTIQSIENQLQALTDAVVKASGEAAAANARYEGMQGYLLNYIDLPGMVKSLHALAEEVEEDILDSIHKVTSVH